LKRTIHAHEMVVNLARELTLASYESLMASNRIRAEWKRTHPGVSELGLQSAFVKKYLSAHLSPARATLAGMLAQPIDESWKVTIHDALLKDASLIRGRTLQ